MHSISYEEFQALPSGEVPVLVRVRGYRGGALNRDQVRAVLEQGYEPMGQLEMLSGMFGCYEDNFAFFKWKAYALGFDAIVAAEVSCTATALRRVSNQGARQG